MSSFDEVEGMEQHAQNAKWAGWPRGCIWLALFTWMVGTQGPAMVFAQSSRFLTNAGQQNPGEPPRSTAEALAQFSKRAGVVFAGEVTAIRIAEPDKAVGNFARRDGSHPLLQPGMAEDAPLEQGRGWVEITFRIEEAVVGCASNQPYVLREWAGLWVNQAPRFWVGERAVWFFYPPSKTGTSSPVGGMAGVLPLQGRGAAEQVDLRWLQTRLLRPAATLRRPITTLQPVRGDAMDAEAARQEAEPASIRMLQQEGYPVANLEKPNASYATVLGVLHALAAGIAAGQF
ncbi:MAG: hypothetical protein ACYC46_12915 [Acidobacteriaceae bacterium]